MFLEVWESAFGAGVGLLVGAVVVRVRGSGSGEGGWTSCGGENFWARGRIAIRKLYGIDSLRSQSLVEAAEQLQTQPQPGLAEALRTFRSHDTQLASARNYEV